MMVPTCSDDISAALDERRRADTLMAPFADFPDGKFDVAGRCNLCDEFGWLDYFVVWPSSHAWPPVCTSHNCYCRPCMVVMGVGADGR